MNDVSGNWIPSTDEDGIETALETFYRNVRQRLQERRTRLDDDTLEIPVAEARRRLLEAQ